MQLLHFLARNNALCLHSHNQEAKKLVQDIRHEGYTTNTLQALEKARDLFTNRSKKFPGKPRDRQVFMITDGKPNAPRNSIQNLLLASARLKLMRAEMFILLVGGENVDGLRRVAAMASTTDRHFYRVKTYEDFVDAVNMIHKYI